MTMPPDRLDPRTLEVFLAVAETGSATLAARRLHVSQPQVSQAIQRLETAAGMTLFERGRHGMRLTAEGELMLAAVRQSYAGLDNVASAMAAIRDGARGQVVVGTFPIYADGFVAEALGELARESPELAVSITIEYGDAIVRQVLQGQVDLGIVLGPIGPHAQLDSEVLGQRRLFALMRQDHRLAGQSQVSAADLVDVDLINYGPGHPYRAMISQALLRHGALIRSRIESATQAAAVRLALHSGAVALVDDEAVHIGGSARALPLADSPAWDVVAIWSRERTPSLAQAAALERMRKAFHRSR